MDKEGPCRLCGLLTDRYDVSFDEYTCASCEANCEEAAGTAKLEKDFTDYWEGEKPWPSEG